MRRFLWFLVEAVPVVVTALVVLNLIMAIGGK